MNLPEMKNFKAKNIHQKMALDLLHDKSTPAKCLVGIAGSGKTRLAIQYGLHLLAEGDIQKIFITRNPATVGESIGFLPGDKSEKINFITQPILDNLENGEFGLAHMIQKEQLEFDAPNFLQGRDIRHALVIVDEAQMMDRALVKMLGSRVGEGSQIVFVGDYEQAFDKRYKGENNGLLHMINALKGEKIFGVMELQDSVRGPVAEMFAKMDI
ncbi:PhoH-like phosphate starvation-inducible [Bacillus phage G]|uniref:Gp162 n=1 Tax=Bacillus phage G TaxID=2884420 RepID=G3MBM8_9CAUD|nr:PhoH-like phosphate starvation-inducible [Bacillus phage G]AEO93422.1 gp162 [Bacillus phage G]